MAKAKTSPSATKTPGAHLPDGLGDQLAKAISLAEAKKFTEAAPALETLAKEAKERGLLGLERTVRTYQALLPAKTKAKAESAPEMEAQLLLNHGDLDGALAMVDKALKGDAANANLHYLRATVLARKEQAEPSAESMRKAMELNPDYIFIYRLEPDFEAIRRQPAYVPLERM